MEIICEILTSAEVWKILIPAIIAILAWYLNERSKRIQQEYIRKEENYKELLRTLRGFYISKEDNNLKDDFLHQLNLCWLYAPDKIIKKAYKFLDLINTQASESDDEKEKAVGDFVSEIRRDLISRKIVKETKLKAHDFIVASAKST
jgi:hypothetical protein